jgi:hypothetical protein
MKRIPHVHIKNKRYIEQNYYKKEPVQYQTKGEKKARK